ncbi:hypothetical protein SLE2022_278060 [Rubroshorea leprosula]
MAWDEMAKSQNSISASLPNSSLINKQEIQGEEKKHNGELGDLFDTQFTNFPNDPEDYSISNGCYISNTTANASNYLTTSLESCLTKEDSSGRDLGLDYCNFSDAAQSFRCDDIVEEGPDIEALDFHFVDDNASSSYYSPFEMAEEIEGPVERTRKEKEMKEVMGKKVEESLDSPSSSVETGSSSGDEGGFCLWSSLDLPTICFVN